MWSPGVENHSSSKVNLIGLHIFEDCTLLELCKSQHNSKTQLTPGGTEAACHFPGSWQTSNALACKQVDMGALPIDSTISPRGTRLKHRGRSHKPFEAGVIPAPATNFREVIRLPVCKTGVFKQAGSDDWSVTSTSHQPSPTACQRAKAAAPELQRRRALHPVLSRLRLGMPFLDS